MYVNDLYSRYDGMVIAIYIYYISPNIIYNVEALI